jgi:hypothetical protein
MSEFFVNRLGGKGHIDATGDENNNMLSARYIGLASDGWCLCVFHNLKNKLAMLSNSRVTLASCCARQSYSLPSKAGVSMRGQKAVDFSGDEGYTR